jgi:glutathionylspermidine synthase
MTIPWNRRHSMNTYEKERRNFYKTISNFWPDLYGEEYALYDIAPIKEPDIQEIRLCTSRVGKIYTKAASLLRNASNQTYTEMGFPKETFEFLRLKTIPTESTIARLDLVRIEDTYKCIEINSDTPTFIKELFYVNGQAANEFGMEDPNERMEDQLGKAVKVSIAHAATWLQEPEPYIVFTAHDDNVEDKNTVIYLQELYGLPAKFIPLHELRIVPEKGLYDESGRKIDILYRQTFPIESLILDEDTAGNKIGQWLIDLVLQKKLAIINPPSAFLLQNKAVQAVIWGLHESKDAFFTDEEHQWIENYFLPTYLEPDLFLEKGVSFVKKPVFGREGDTVQIYGLSGKLITEENQQNYLEVTPIFQQYVELPTITYNSKNGRSEGHMLIGSFLVNGEPSAIGFRVGGEITNNLSCFLPAGVVKERGEK